mmetsp:Transcript_17586/g.61476  ORF Transcript_17586/g.61476 Transcript_17586/m.61476 type:complete len:271 (-) Transcript_17586:1150-1962(-)
MALHNLLAGRSNLCMCCFERRIEVVQLRLQLRNLLLGDLGLLRSDLGTILRHCSPAHGLLQLRLDLLLAHRRLLCNGLRLHANSRDLFLLALYLLDLLVRDLLLRLLLILLRKGLPLLHALLRVGDRRAQRLDLLVLGLSRLLQLLALLLSLLQALLQAIDLSFHNLLALPQVLDLVLPSLPLLLRTLHELQQLLRLLLRLHNGLVLALRLGLRALGGLRGLPPELQELGAQGQAPEAVSVLREVREQGLGADFDDAEVDPRVHLHAHGA